MRTLFFIVLGLVIFGALGTGATMFLAPDIERELTDSVQLELRDAGIPEDRVQVDGRDIWVAADAMGDAAFERIEATLAGVSGIRRIRRLPAGEVVEMVINESALIEVKWAYRTMSVRGLLGEQSNADAMVTSLRQRFPELDIADSIRIDSIGGSALWEQTLPDVVALVRGSVPEGSIMIRGRDFTVRGEVEDENVRSEIGERLVAKLPGMTLANQIRMPNASGPVALAIAEIIQGRTIGFEYQSDELTREAEDILARVAVVLEDHPDVMVRLEGYADGRGRPTTSFVLSRLKAEVVRDFLVRMGADSSSIVVRAMGEAERAEGEDLETAGRAEVRIVVDTE